MAYPLTHLCVANRVVEVLNISAPEDFLLGAIAPDAVHYREGFKGTQMTNIGAEKKITHLCPISDEKWGRVTDNDGWINCVHKFLQGNKSDFALGYATHVLTDIVTNMWLWGNFRNKYPQEAAKGYNSGYHTDLHKVDIRIYHTFFKDSKIRRLLQAAAPQGIAGLVTAEEVQAIQDNLLHVSYKNVPPTADTTDCFYVTYEQTLEIIDESVSFCVDILKENL